MSWVRVAWSKCTLLYVSYMLVQISFFISSTYIVFVFIDPKISTPMNQGRVPHNNLSFHRGIPPSYHNFIKWRPSTPFLDPVDPGTLWLWLWHFHYLVFPSTPTVVGCFHIWYHNNTKSIPIGYYLCLQIVFCSSELLSVSWFYFQDLWIVISSKSVNFPEIILHHVNQLNCSFGCCLIVSLLLNWAIGIIVVMHV